MRDLRVFCTVLFTSLLTACAGGSPDSPRPTLTLTYTAAPIELTGISAKFAQDVRYGSGERNVLDIYMPDCSGPTPLVIYIHGGGFTGGNKEGTHTQNEAGIKEILQACVAYATINYFLLDVPDTDESLQSAVDQGGVLTSLKDAARALQFMRYHAASFNLDSVNIASYGGSAGAGASLWLGTHDDMADPGNADPVLRESTRIKAVGAIATQATYDLLLWEDILLPVSESFAEVLGGTDVVTLASAVGAANYLLTFLGVASVDDIFTEENQAYRANIDMLGLMDSGDAPIFVHNFDTGFDDLLNLFLHHGLHALAVRDRADEVGLHNVAYVNDPDFGLEDPSGEELVPFLLRHIR
jgi:para-nitrobenzyl esterase